MSSRTDKIDQGYAAFVSIQNDVAALEKSSWSESDTRLKIIDRILFEALGWDKNKAVKTEDRAGKGFTDYTLSISDSVRLIVEAKKGAIDFGLEHRESTSAYKLNGAVFTESAKDAINQAIYYSAFKSCELACVTNGEEWIIFRANRLGDGKDILDGKGFIFTSLEGIGKNFKLFFDLIGQRAVESLTFRGEFQKAEGVPVRDLSFLKAPRSSDSKKQLTRSEFAADFDAIMSSFFERLKGDQDPEMIQKCFVETQESNLADEKLLRISEDLVGKVRGLDTSTGHELVELIEAAKLQHKNRFILLAGSKGAGKSTFIDRFFKFILPKETAQGIVLLRVDLSLTTGDEEQVVAWLNSRMIEECEKVVFRPEHAEWDDYIGKIFFDDYQRWSTGTMSHLYKTNKDQFRIEFGRHIEKIRETQSHEYIKRLINFITKSNQKVPCLIFDNTDHFTIQFQETVFQYARSLYESEFCIVIIPITDKTSWQLSKHGALQSFESEVLSLPVPKTERILERRITFLLDKLNIEDESRRKAYFLSRGIRLELADVGRFAKGINSIFVESADTAKWIGGLANFDIRRLLELTKETIASPHLKLDDLLKAHIVGSAGVVAPHRVKQAIIKKRYDIYPLGEHSFVQNMFALSLEPASTPLLGVRILEYLRDAGFNNETQQKQWVPIDAVYEHLSALGIHKHIIANWLEVLLKTGLVSNYDPTLLAVDSVTSLEISSSGQIHLTWATADIDYIQIMKDVTPLRDKNVYEQIISDFKDYKNKWRDSISVFIDYLIKEDETYCVVPNHPSFDDQRAIKERILWRKKRMLESDFKQ